MPQARSSSKTSLISLRDPVEQALVEGTLDGITGGAVDGEPDAAEQQPCVKRCKAAIWEFIFGGPCFPTRDDCKQSKTCFDPGCKKKPLQAPLLDTKGLVACGYRSKSVLRPKQQWCTVILMILGVWFLVSLIVQFLCFHFATFNCNGGAPADDYDFPGGGIGAAGNASVNLVPRHTILVERKPMWYGMTFDVYNATSEQTTSGAPVGVWFQTWGPFFATYTYQDVLNSQPTIYMRESIQGMSGGYRDTYIMRCDGKGMYARMSEGQHFFINRVRTAFGMNQGYELKVWEGDHLVAYAKETFHGAKSITFVAGGNQISFASGSMIGRKFEGEDGEKYSQWFIRASRTETIPYYHINGMTALYAFRVRNLGLKNWKLLGKISKEDREEARHPDFLAEQEIENSSTLSEKI